MSEKWILIVDDEESTSTVISDGLDQLGQDYHMIAVPNGEAALEQIKQHLFDLVVTDFNLEGMNGLQLMHQVQMLHPGTRVVLMTAGPDSDMEAEASRLNVFGYLAKPLEMEAFLKIVQEAVGTSGSGRGGSFVLSEDDYRKLNRVLDQLGNDVAARCVFLTDREGRTIACTGLYTGLDISRIASLLSGSIATLAEAGRTINDFDDAVHLEYCEGKSESLYAINIGSQFLLIILIDRGSSSSRLGLVWYYAKLAAASLLEGLTNAKYSSPGNLLGDIEQVINGELDKILGNDQAANTGKKGVMER